MILQLNRLEIHIDSNMDSATYHQLPETLDKTNARNFGLFNCGMTDKKLRSFNESAAKKNIKVNIFEREEFVQIKYDFI